MECNSNLKANLFYLDNGYYLSRNDPLFWKKLFQRQKDNEEAMYHVGLDMEIQAKKYLDTYYTTMVIKYLVLYRKARQEAYSLIKRSLNKGFLPARFEILRMEREMRITDKELSKLAKPATFSKKQIMLLFIAAIILSVVGAFFFLPSKVSRATTNVSHNYTYMLPYEVIEKKPTNSMVMPNIQAAIIILEKEVSREALVNALIARLKMDYEKYPRTAKQVLAMDENNQEIGMAVWGGGEQNIQVYIYPSDGEVAIKNKELQLWETTTVVRSALFQFIKKNGYIPKDLKALNQGYPNNYLSQFPKEPYKLKNTVTTSPTRDGGWLFSPVEFPNDKDLVSVVKEVLKPNLPYYKDIPFDPLFIEIDKGSNTLSVISKEQIIRIYYVALGKGDTTPEGDLLVSKKVMNPDKFIPSADNVYGTRAMELSNLNYAIHGTNTPSSIGENVSQGCIRLNNLDMEELYAITPLNTGVYIYKNGSPAGLIRSNPYILNKSLYNNSDNSMEETFIKYHWAN